MKAGVEDIFCSFIIIVFIFIVPWLHKHLGTGEWMYGCLLEASITWSPLKFITPGTRLDFQCYVLYKHFTVLRSILARVAVTVCTRSI